MLLVLINKDTPPKGALVSQCYVPSSIHPTLLFAKTPFIFVALFKKSVCRKNAVEMEQLFYYLLPYFYETAVSASNNLKTMYPILVDADLYE